jgi:putative ABC transport system ATP-binding protein
MNTYAKDFENIMKVHDKQKESSKISERIKAINLPPFKVSYTTNDSKELPFTLVSNNTIELNEGDVALLRGVTGSGKSTLLNLLVGNIKFQDFVVHYIPDIEGEINSLIHDPNTNLGCKNVLQEILFCDVNYVPTDVELQRLEIILKGLHLYDEIKSKSGDVIEYLVKSYIKQYSAGQKQRFAIARLLYHLNESIDIVAFDEATNALDDAIALQSLGFIQEFCNIDRRRIIVIASHQLDIVTSYANKEYTFKNNTDGSFEIVKTK